MRNQANAREDFLLGKAREAVLGQPSLDAPSVRITMLDETVVLTGVVDSSEAVRCAGEAVRNAVPGVSVENGLTVLKSPQARKDRHLTAKAMVALAAAADQFAAPPKDIGVIVRRGVAHLQGFCTNASERDRCALVVGRIAGIRGVNAEALGISEVANADDMRIADYAHMVIENADLGINGRLKVHMRDGIATVGGDVRNVRDRDRVLELVAGVAGVRSVRSELRVLKDGAGSTGSFRVEQRLIQALARAALPMPDISVFLVDGTATLTGMVDTDEQRELASHVAFCVEGVEQVDNRLEPNKNRGRTARV